MKTIAKSTVLGLLALAVTTSPLWAAGYSIYEQGAKASGMAGAWVARADDASANWYNPAALVWLDGAEIQLGTNLITAGADTELTSSDPNFGLFAQSTFEMESNLGTPSSFYVSSKINPNFAWGLGINNPYGLITEWQDRPVTFSARESELVTFYLNPNVALRLTETLALGIGVTYVDAEITEFSREVPIDLDGNPFNGFEVIGASNLTGDGDDWGWNVALHHKGQNTSFGFTYRSGITVSLDGNIDFENFGPLAPFFQDSPGTADLPLPAQAAIGFAWGTQNAWTFEVDVAWAEWSDFDNLFIDIQNNVPGFVDDVLLREDWDDTMSYRFGASFNNGGNHEWRFGAVFDESAAPPETVRPSIPESDRFGVSVGWGYTGNKWNFDAYYMPLWVDDITTVGGEEGVIEGTYSSFVNLAGLSVTRRF